MISKFFRMIWRLLAGLMKALQVLIFFGFILIFILIFRDKSDGGFSVPDSAALVLAPSGVLVEQVEGEPLDLALSNIGGGAGPGQTVVRDIVESLRTAASDDRIKAVVLLPQLLQVGGLAKLQVVGDALDEFRASGKPVIAMADNYDQTQYYLAARADEIYMHDFGLVVIEGFGYFKTYFADAIEKLKVDVNVFVVGEFKSFVDPYWRNDMSDEDKIAAEVWLNGLWQAFQTDVTAARDIQPTALVDYVEQLPELLRAHDGNAAEAALSAGLVDGLMSHQEFRDYIIDLVGVKEDEPDEFNSIDFRTYLYATRLADSVQSDPGSNVGVLVASGTIVDGEAAPGAIGGATLSRLIRQAANDESIGALVLRVDSPGGSMFASEVVYDQLQELKARGKPLVVSMGSVAASGGYYISLPADEIWASETSISGSIGVGAIYPTFQRSLQSLGVTVDGFGTTPLSGQFNGVLELSEEARELLNISVESAYDVFIAKVAEARDMQFEEVDEVARGRVWIGTDALEIGLVDRLGSLEDAIASAASLADLEQDTYGIKYVQRELSFSEQVLLQYAKLLGALFGQAGAGVNSGSGAQALLQRFAEVMREPLNMLTMWNDPRGVYLHCFCDMR